MVKSKTKRKRTKTAKKASSAGKKSEKAAKKFLRKRGKYDLFLNAKGIPDIIALDRNGNWRFYEVKPHKKRRGYKKTGTWYSAGDKDRLLRPSQKTEFKKLVGEGADINIIYYYRKRFGTKANPKYKFRCRLHKLGKNDFKSRKGPDPDKLQLIDKKLEHWMNNRRV